MLTWQLVLRSCAIHYMWSVINADTAKNKLTFCCEQASVLSEVSVSAPIGDMLLALLA